MTLMRTKRTLACGLLIAGLLYGSVPVEAGAAGKILGKGVAGRGLSGKASGQSARDALRRDVLRDRATPVRPLSRSRSAVRYTTRERAREELRHGIPPGRHMAPAHAGRPLRRDHALKRYGLPRAPEVRESIRLPAGQPVRSNKALGGGRGVGEITSPRPVPPAAIKKVSPVSRPKPRPR